MTDLTRRSALKASILSISGVAAKAATSSGSLVFEQVNVVTSTGELLRGQTVVIEGDRITEVGRTAQLSVKPNPVQAAGKYLIPGLWDMHVHLSYTKASALPILLANGVTGVRDCGSYLHELDEWQTEIQVGALAGPQIFRAGPQVNSKVFAPVQIAVVNDAEARGAVKALQICGVDFIKVLAAMNREAYFGVAGQCKQMNLPFGGHLPRVISWEECSNAGQATLEHIDGLFDGKTPPAATPTEKLAFIQQWKRNQAPGIFELFAKNRTYYTPTLVVSAYPYLKRLAEIGRGEQDGRAKYISKSSQAFTAGSLVKYKELLTPESIEAERPSFLEYLQLVAAMNAAGVPLLAGTDFASAAVCPGFSIHDELEWLVKAGLSPADALKTATVNPASLFGLEDLGAIAPGKIANLVLLDQNPLEDIRNTTRINSVVYRGKLVNRDALDALLESGAAMAAKS